jgi:signal peptidase I
MRRFVKDFLLPMAVAVALAFVIQAAVAKPYEIPTESMVPTIQANDRIIANRLIYRFRDIERGDIVVFDPPLAATRTCGDAGGGNIPFVKRVIGLPGDRVQVRRDGTTLVNGKPYVVGNARTPHYTITFPVVPEDSVLVLGDNRDQSCDAHQWRGTDGEPAPFVPMDAVIGQAEITYWPPSHIGFLD